MDQSDSDDEPPQLIVDELLPSLPNEPKEDAQSAARVPLTVVTGFLGAGKSALVNRILSTDHGRRIAVILNEFGPTSDVEKILAVREGAATGADDPSDERNEAAGEIALSEEWLELDNGCLCCSLKKPGVRAIELLMEKRGRFDHILLETTGLADPYPIAEMFWLPDELGAMIRLDGIVTVVDSKNFSRHLGKDPELLKQVALADRILLNKMDLVTLDEMDAVEKEVTRVNPVAQTKRTIKSEVDVDFVLGIAGYDLSSSGTDLDLAISKLSNQSQPESAAACSCADASHDHVEPHLSPQRDISALSIILPGSFDSKRFTSFLHKLLWDDSLPGHNPDLPMEIMRLKAAVHLVALEDDEGNPKPPNRKKTVVQAVHELYELVETADVWGDGTPENKIVLIGRNLERSFVENGFREALADSHET